jgi:phage shock protein PspC (stress-responsive transcriptional regulator)
MQKRLYRVNEGKMIAGVCGGIAEYLNIDPTVVRLIWAMIGLSGAGIVAYLIAALVIPVKPLGIEE